jgi:septal ring factor EnvC (AmiA/AmiB activator)
MKSLIPYLPLLLLAITVISAGAVAQQRIAQLEGMHNSALQDIKEQRKELQQTREEASDTAAELRSVNERTKRMDEKLDRLLERRR